MKWLPSFFFVAIASAVGQSADVREVYGTVAGTVTCTDINLPGRLTEVSLTPVSESASPLDAKTGKPVRSPMITLYQTRLDGTFLIPRVPPGRYYVVAQKAGYLSAASMYTKSQLDHPATPEQAKEIAANIPVILVAAGQTTSLNLPLHRAASVSGTLKFDDGSPASTLEVSFSRLNPDGKWSRVQLTTPNGGQADDLGHFRVGGLPAGEYRMEAHLNVVTRRVSGVFDPDGSMALSYGGGLAIYYGATFFSKDARLIKLDDGQDLTADLTIPIAKLHSVSGALVDARTGKVVNAGTIEVLEPGSTQVLTSVRIDPDDSTFRLEYVPEGELTVRVSHAGIVNRVPDPYPPGSFGTPRYKETLLQSYAPYEAPLTVKTDMQGVNLPVVPQGVPDTRSHP